jgi:nucleotide-binding universal stress UspA family protein
MNIELYCIKNSIGIELKSKLRSALASNHLPYTIEEINESGEFLKDGAFSVPVIRVLNKLIAFDAKSTIDHMVKSVIDDLLSEGRQFILVPVDFTPESVHALRYALIIAAKLRMGVTIAYIHQPIMDTGIVGNFDGEMQKIHREKLENMISEVSQEDVYSGKYVPVNTLFDVGDIKSRIFRLVSEDRYALIMMSTQAEKTFLKRMQGSVSLTVGRHSLKPVIVVPIGTPLKFPDKMTIGLSDELLADNALDYILDFASDYKVFLDFVHIGNDFTEFNRLKDLLSEKIATSGKGPILHKIHRVHLGHDYIATELKDFATISQANIIVLVTHNRKLMESLSHNSTSKELLLQPTIPVMVLHGNQNTESHMSYFAYEAIK